MSRRNLYALVLILAAACGDGGSGPTTTTGVTISCPGGTIFLGNTVQCEARATLSDGTSQPAPNAVWQSSNPSVATVSPTGLVTAIAAGQTTLTADVNPRGVLEIRVYPDFGGSWSGNEILAGCQDSGLFEGLCDDLLAQAATETFTHRSSFTQTDASVTGVIDGGDGSMATSTGTIGVGGLLQLPPVQYFPDEPPISSELQNWRSRADTPSRMTGSYEIFLTAAGLDGSVRARIRLENVERTSTSATATSSSAFQRTLRWMTLQVEAKR